ncbi:hypothetical protein ISCGN_005322 [Ixodes scapularis]
MTWSAASTRLSPACTGLPEFRQTAESTESSAARSWPGRHDGSDTRVRLCYSQLLVSVSTTSRHDRDMQQHNTSTSVTSFVATAGQLFIGGHVLLYTLNHSFRRLQQASDVVGVSWVSLSRY